MVCDFKEFIYILIDMDTPVFLQAIAGYKPVLVFLVLLFFADSSAMWTRAVVVAALVKVTAVPGRCPN